MSIFKKKKSRILLILFIVGIVVFVFFGVLIYNVVSDNNLSKLLFLSESDLLFYFLSNVDYLRSVNLIIDKNIKELLKQLKVLEKFKDIEFIVIFKIEVKFEEIIIFFKVEEVKLVELVFILEFFRIIFEIRNYKFDIFVLVERIEKVIIFGVEVNVIVLVCFDRLVLERD